MRAVKFLSLFACLLAMAVIAPSAISGEMVLGLSPDVDELELYKSPKDEDAAKIVVASDLSFPTAILAVSDNGMYKIKQKGTEFWVITDDVKTDILRKVDAACDPKMAGTIVAHGKRGAGEGC